MSLEEKPYLILFSCWKEQRTWGFGRQGCSDYQDKLQVLLGNIFLQLMIGIKRFNREVLPCAPRGCGSDGENAAGAERLKGEGPVFLLYPSARFKELNRAREGVQD